MPKKSQQKGKRGEIELTEILRNAGHNAIWGGSQTFGTVPDIRGLPEIHIECKRNERLNISNAMQQSITDAERFNDGAPCVFHRRNRENWLVTMRLDDWLKFYERGRSCEKAKIDR